MNADAFRHLYEYHFAENRSLWERVQALPQAKYTQAAAYSHGSVRDHVLHLMWVDDIWFSQLRRVDHPAPPDADVFADRAFARAYWDEVEQHLRDYLATLRDEMLFEKPFPNHPEDKDLVVWQVLFHVVNHGTDHRAQILRLLNDLGVETTSQDYVFYAYGHALE